MACLASFDLRYVDEPIERTLIAFFLIQSLNIIDERAGLLLHCK